MSFLNTVLKSFLGDKNAKDLKEVKKVVAKIKAAEPNIQTLTDDGLREKQQNSKKKSNLPLLNSLPKLTK